MARILISCGEPSGDLYAGALTAAVRDLDPGTRVFGLGGDRLRDSGAELVGHYRGLAASDVVVTASGTATVQAAIHERPMVIVYRLSALTYRIVKTFSHVGHAGMANLIAGERIVPELLQDAFTPAAVADEVVAFLTDAERAERTRAALGRVRARLGSAGASRRTAERILAVAGRRTRSGCSPGDGGESLQ